MPNLFEGLRGEEGVFSDETVLSPEFQPEVLPGRESELKEMALLLKPLIEERKAPAIMAFGPPGTGKTSCVKHVLKELKDYSSSVESVYVNCWTHSTRQSVLNALSHSLGLALPRRGLASDEVFARVSEAVGKGDKKLLVALDEVDRLFFVDNERVLYDLARSLGDKVSLVLLTNDKTVFQTLDARTKSSLSVSEVEFARYSPEALKRILSERAARAFRKDACGKEAVALCSAFASKHGGDARVAIECLWVAGKQAEKRNALSVGEGDCKKAFEQQEKLSASKAKRLEGLSPIEQQVLEALQGREMTSGELYAKLPDHSERIVRTYVNLLELKKLVELREKDDGRGKTRVITPLV